EVRVHAERLARGGRGVPWPSGLEPVEDLGDDRLDAALVDRHGSVRPRGAEAHALPDTAPARFMKTTRPSRSPRSPMPQITASTGLARDTSVSRADEPCATRTSSPSPAPTASAATTKPPAGWNWASTSRTSISLSDISAGSLRVETTVPMTW